MKASDLKPASSFAKIYGVKALVYGPPGSGKTPLIKTAPNPVMLSAEPGLLSMRDAHTVPVWEARTCDQLDEFFKWVFESSEMKKFDTLCVDSTSQLAEIYLEGALTGKSNAGKKVHGLAAYGQMATNAYAQLSKLFYTKELNVYLIAKETTIDCDGIAKKAPYYPGKELNVKVPHLYDEIWRLDKLILPEAGAKPVAAFRTEGDVNFLCRDRSGRLNMYEPPNLRDIFNKCMS